MIPDSRRLELERQLLKALQHGGGNPAQRLMAAGVQEALQQLFLDQSDAVLQSLLDELGEWQSGQRSGPSPSMLDGLARLSGLAQDQRLDAIRTLSDCLRQALTRVNAGAMPSNAPSLSDCQQGAEELARLLFLYAAGQQREASSEVLAQLRR